MLLSNSITVMFTHSRDMKTSGLKKNQILLTGCPLMGATMLTSHDQLGKIACEMNGDGLLYRIYNNSV